MRVLVCAEEVYVLFNCVLFTERERERERERHKYQTKTMKKRPEQCCVFVCASPYAICGGGSLTNLFLFSFLFFFFNHHPQYLDDLHCSFDHSIAVLASPAVRERVIDWLLGYAVTLEYEDIGKCVCVCVCVCVCLGFFLSFHIYDHLFSRFQQVLKATLLQRQRLIVSFWIFSFFHTHTHTPSLSLSLHNIKRALSLSLSVFSFLFFFFVCCLQEHFPSLVQQHLQNSKTAWSS